MEIVIRETGMMESSDVRAWRDYLSESLVASVGAGFCAGGITPLEPVAQVPRGIEAIDGVGKFLIRAADGAKRGVALCASSVAPQLVARGMTRAREAKRMLGLQLGRVILDPLYEGSLDGRTCAVLPYCPPLSESRWRRKWQKKTMAPALTRWFREVCRATRWDGDSDDTRRTFAACLTCVGEEPAVPDAVRRGAVTALDRLDRGLWIPCHVLSHNDVWDGNILIDRRSASDAPPRAWNDRFVLIDWPGATLRGFGLIDLLRLARTLPLAERRLRDEVVAHCQILGCDVVDAQSHLLSAIGNILAHRENFPMPLFARMAEICWERLELVVG